MQRRDGRRHRALPGTRESCRVILIVCVCVLCKWAVAGSSLSMSPWGYSIITFILTPFKNPITTMSYHPHRPHQISRQLEGKQLVLPCLMRAQWSRNVPSSHPISNASGRPIAYAASASALQSNGSTRTHMRAF